MKITLGSVQNFNPVAGSEQDAINNYFRINIYIVILKDGSRHAHYMVSGILNRINPCIIHNTHNNNIYVRCKQFIMYHDYLVSVCNMHSMTHTWHFRSVHGKTLSATSP